MIGAWVHTGVMPQVRAALEFLHMKGKPLDFLVLQPKWHQYASVLSPHGEKLWYRCDTIQQVRALPEGATCVFMDEVNVKPDGYPGKAIPAADYAKLLLDARRARPDITFVQAPVHPIGNWWQRLMWDMRHDDAWSDAVARETSEGPFVHFHVRGWNPNKTRWREVDRVLMRYTNEPAMLLSPAPFNGGWWERTVQPIKPPTWIALGRSQPVHVALWQLIEDGPHGLVTTGGELTWTGRQLT